MDQVWIGYEEIAFVPGSLTREGPHTGLLRDDSGVPLLCGAQRVYVSEDAMHRLRRAVMCSHSTPSLQVRSSRPVGHRRAGLNYHGEEARSEREIHHYGDITVDLAV